MVRKSVLVLAGAAALLTSCGASEEKAATGGLRETVLAPCDLLPMDALNEKFGGTFETSEKVLGDTLDKGGNVVSHCNATSGDADIALMLLLWPSRDVAQNAFIEMKRGAGMYETPEGAPAPTREVAGLGDEAFVIEHKLGGINARQGELVFTVSLMPQEGTSAERYAAQEELARHISESL